MFYYLIITLGLLALLRSWHVVNYFRALDHKKQVSFFKAWEELTNQERKKAALLYLYIVPFKKRRNETTIFTAKRNMINTFTYAIYVLVISFTSLRIIL